MTRTAHIRTRQAVTTAVVLAALACPAVARAQGPGPITRAIRAEAARLVEAGSAVAVAEQGRAGLAAWTSVANIKAGEEILLTRSGGLSENYRLLSVQDDGLTILDVPSRAVSSDVAGELREEAGSRPERFDAARRGSEFDLGHDVRLGPAGVSQDGRHLFPLSLVVVHVPRDEVAEISVLRKHVGAHARRGMIIGGIVGALLVGVSITNCDDCGSRLSYPMMGGLFGAGVGSYYGFIVGALWPRTAELVYRR